MSSCVRASQVDLQSVRLQAQTFSAQLHDAVGAEGVPDFVLTDGRQPERRVHLQLGRRDEDGLVTRVDAAERNQSSGGGFEPATKRFREEDSAEHLCFRWR